MARPKPAHRLTRRAVTTGCLAGGSVGVARVVLAEALDLDVDDRTGRILDEGLVEPEVLGAGELALLGPERADHPDVALPRIGAVGYEDARCDPRHTSGVPGADGVEGEIAAFDDDDDGIAGAAGVLLGAQIRGGKIGRTQGDLLTGSDLVVQNGLCAGQRIQRGERVGSLVGEVGP